MSEKQMGSSIDDFLKEEVIAWQLAAAMKKKRISKNRMATGYAHG